MQDIIKKSRELAELLQRHCVLLSINCPECGGSGCAKFDECSYQNDGSGCRSDAMSCDDYEPCPLCTQWRAMAMRLCFHEFDYTTKPPEEGKFLCVHCREPLPIGQENPNYATAKKGGIWLSAHELQEVNLWPYFKTWAREKLGKWAFFKFWLIMCDGPRTLDMILDFMREIVAAEEGIVSGKEKEGKDEQ